MQGDTVKILLFLTQGFEDLEAIAILDVFAWTHYREYIKKANVTTAGFHKTVISHCGLRIRPDLQFPEIIPENYQAFVLPGGFHSQGFDEAYSSKIHIRRLKEGGALATNKHVVIDDRIISCDGPGSSLDVAFLLMECLMGSETARKVRQYMIYKPIQESQS